MGSAATRLGSGVADHKRIAVVDLCRPSDVHPAQLLTAAIRKQQTYLPLLDALSHYSEQGWTIHVFPWAVGIRGMIKPMHVHSLMKFAGIHHKHWTTAVESTVLASVKAFHFLHRVRFGGLPETVRSDPDPDHNDSDIENEEKMKRPERLPRSTTQECAAESVETPCTHKRAYRFLADQAANARTVRVIWEFAPQRYPDLSLIILFYPTLSVIERTFGISFQDMKDIFVG